MPPVHTALLSMSQCSFFLHLFVHYRVDSMKCFFYGLSEGELVMPRGDNYFRWQGEIIPANSAIIEREALSQIAGVNTAAVCWRLCPNLNQDTILAQQLDCSCHCVQSFFFSRNSECFWIGITGVWCSYEQQSAERLRKNSFCGESRHF